MVPFDLLALPTDLFLEILGHLQPKDIMNIGLSCRDLALLATPVYLARRGLPDPETSCTIRPSWNGYSDKVTALTFNFSLVSVQQFHCVFTEPKARGVFKVSLLTWNIRRVNKFISRLSSIGNATIALYPYSLHTDSMRDFMPAFVELLETILQKCNSLQVSHPSPYSMAFNTNYRFELLESTTALIWQGIRRLFVKYLSFRTEDHFLEGSDWRYKKIPRRNPIPLSKSPLQLQSKLTTLDLSSDFLLLPPFSPWIFGALKCSPISSLTLSLLTSIPAEEFRHFIFPWIIDAVPRLEEIKISFSYRDSLFVVVQSMSSFPLLRKITFGGQDFNLPPTLLSSAECNMVHFISFTGTLDQAVYFFAQPMSFPSLKFINVVYDLVRTNNPNILQLSNSDSLSTKFSILDKRLSEMNIEPLITMCLLPHGTTAQPQIPQDELELEKLNGVSRLNIALPFFSGPEDKTLVSQASYVRLCLALFHDVKALSLVFRDRQSPLNALSQEARRSTIQAAVLKDHPSVISFDIAYDPFEVFHGHWRNSSNNSNRHRHPESCVCSDF
ncbi:hypothetical protein GALMADRAFT_238636 [Galerina marginata CBS 339.88]|uniref:F-box domain-containing protein n=1 Tax=Galerina marginata (strain CBS 339.88) TaxID=685588 RepID=A0A067TID9_GALM3|nr:hypothetical protein GALMADRAFT_238636 [Galerina marginata CBS 339.88]